MQPKTIIFIGPQGSGKGTQVELLAETYQATGRPVSCIQTGDIFRSLGVADSYVAKAVQAHIEAGNLMPDAITNGLVVERILQVVDAKKTLIFDGYPRSKSQVEILFEVLKFFGRTKADVIHLDTPDSVVIERMQARNRSDDTSESIASRLAIYHAETEPLLDLFNTMGEEVTVIPIAGAQSIEEVQAEIINKLGHE